MYILNLKLLWKQLYELACVFRCSQTTVSDLERRLDEDIARILEGEDTEREEERERYREVENDDHNADKKQQTSRIVY